MDVRDPDAIRRRLELLQAGRGQPGGLRRQGPPLRHGLPRHLHVGGVKTSLFWPDVVMAKKNL